MITLHRFRFALLLAAGFVALPTALATLDASADDKTMPKRFFEMRTYTTHDGKLDALHKRFRDHTNRIFKKHGMQLVGYWTPTDPATAKNTLVYILAYPDKQAREKAWAAFHKDPEWKKVFQESHKDAGGPIVKKVESKFMTPTDYSPIK